MKNIYMTPTVSQAAQDLSNSIYQIVFRLNKLLPQYGYELVDTRDQADLAAAHAGQNWDGKPADVAHISGLYPTAHFPQHDWHWWANQSVIENVRSARIVTVPSQWVADILRRDMHIDPAVVNWGVDTNEWEYQPDSGGYVLWNKTRVDGICDPTPLNRLAALAPDVQFVSTFGDALVNMRLTGRLNFHEMKTIVQRAGVYLSTTLETFGIGTLEAMASGIPILGFNWGGTAEIVEHGVTGYLATPGDYDGLLEGLRYCLKYRKQLGENGREKAKLFTWDKTAAALASVYTNAYYMTDRFSGSLAKANPPKVSVVIPCYNYARFVAQAIESVKAQAATFNFEIIVVDDGSTDDSYKVAKEALDIDPNGGANVTYDERRIVLTKVNGGVAAARNYGIERARGEYVVCLDADDKLGSEHFLQILADALDADRTLGIAYTGLTVMNEAGELAPERNGFPSAHNYELQLQRRNQVPTCCMFRRDAWERAGGYRARYIPAEDANLWTRIGAIGYRAKQITEDGIFHYRLHGNSLSSAVRSGKPEPDWLWDFSWIKTGNRPFACDGKPPRGSWAVRNYNQPLVSVIIPVGPDHERYLQSAIDSVEAQTMPYWELIVVVDDGLPDNEKDLELPYAPYARIVYTSADDRLSGGKLPAGAGAARNLGVQHATAPLVAFLDADDQFAPEFLAKCLKAYKRTGRYVYTDWISLNKEGIYEPHPTPDYDPALVFRESSIHSVSILIDKLQFLSIGGFDETMIAWEDVDLTMKLAAKGVCGVRVPEPLLLYRYTTGNRREAGDKIKSELIAMLRDRYIDYISGRTMCNCPQSHGIRLGGIADFTVNGKSDQSADELVRIEYKGGAGTHEVIGAVTRKSYAYRAYGDTFYVYKVDQAALPDMFQIVADLPVIKPTTPAPADPPLPVLI